MVWRKPATKCAVNRCIILAIAILVNGCDSKPDSPLEILNVRCEQDPYEGPVVATGVVGNLENKEIYNVNVIVELRHGDNRLAGTWSQALTPNPLPVNKSTKFKIVTRKRVKLNGTCRVFLTNAIGKTILQSREYHKVEIQQDPNRK